MSGQEKDEKRTLTDNSHELNAKDDQGALEKAGAPLYPDQILAKTLHNLGIGMEIPPSLYEAASVVLAFVAGLDEKARDRKP